MQDATKKCCHVELHLEPRWPFISCVRKFVAGLFVIGLADKERAEQISMATSELLENAVKYSSEEDQSLKLTISRTGPEVTVQVKNPAEPQQINVLRREFALISAGEPEAVYLKRMEEAARSGGQSRLGLIRIRYEGGAQLSLEVAERAVTIRATFLIEEG